MQYICIYKQMFVHVCDTQMCVCLCIIHMPFPVYTFFKKHEKKFILACKSQQIPFYCTLSSM